ncbi:pyridoxal phosphate-dependent aminotransferase [Candidatus Thorarchaeota archaeon]|nr:MAG: pyridoxal phosphate-dependent aminotransferase [Candidatus Thorarchaeota archaeon]
MRRNRNQIADRSKSVSHSGIREMYNLSLGDTEAIHLEIGEADFPTPRFIIEAAKRAMDEGFTGYTPNSGYLDLRAAISEKLERENSMIANPASEIIVTSGAMQALSLAILVTVNPGEEVIIPDPGYESFSRQVKFAGGVPIPVPVREKNNFSFDSSELAQAISGKSKMIIINTPSNPTGGMMKKAELREIADLAEQHDLLVLSDEIYEKIVYNGEEHVSIASISGMEERTVTIFGFSKSHSMTGWRVGYAVGNSKIVEEMNKIQEFYVTCASSISQRAALAALQEGNKSVSEMVTQLQQRRDFLHEELCRHDMIHSTKPVGAFYLFPNIAKFGRPSTDAAKFLYENASVVTVPGVAFGEHGDKHLRLCFAKSKTDLQAAVERIHTALDEL